MNNKQLYFIMVIIFSFLSFDLVSQDIVKEIVVKPKEIDDILINPGKGFMTFQRFNGDELNDGK